MQLCVLPAVTTPDTDGVPAVPPWFSPQQAQASHPKRATASGSSAIPHTDDLGACAAQALTDQQVCLLLVWLRCENTEASATLLRIPLLSQT